MSFGGREPYCIMRVPCPRRDRDNSRFEETTLTRINTEWPIISFSDPNVLVGFTMSSCKNYPLRDNLWEVTLR